MALAAPVDFRICDYVHVCTCVRSCMLGGVEKTDNSSVCIVGSFSVTYVPISIFIVILHLLT